MYIGRWGRRSRVPFFVYVVVCLLKYQVVQKHTDTRGKLESESEVSKQKWISKEL